jgi:hypothetical protein
MNILRLDSCDLPYASFPSTSLYVGPLTDAYHVKALEKVAADTEQSS